MKTVHFMLNDENGNTRELCSTTDRRQQPARHRQRRLLHRVQQDRPDLRLARRREYTAGRWHEGNQWGAWDWNKKFGSKTVSGETWIWAKNRWLWRSDVLHDGTDDKHLIYSSVPHSAGAQVRRAAASATGKARKGNCNLNSGISGLQLVADFSAGIKIAELTVPGSRITSLLRRRKADRLATARNRATLRVEARARSRPRPDPAADYRTAPRDDAPRYPRAMELPVFAEPAHRLDGVNLPATGDWADQHCCGYYGEVLTLPGFDTVYERLPEGRWRTFRAEGWSDPAAGASEVSEGRTERSSRSLLALEVRALLRGEGPDGPAGRHEGRALGRERQRRRGHEHVG